MFPWSRRTLLWRHLLPGSSKVKILAFKATTQSYISYNTICCLQTQFPDSPSQASSAFLNRFHSFVLVDQSIHWNRVLTAQLHWTITQETRVMVMMMMMIVLRNVHHATIVECFVKTCLRLLHLIVLVLILSNKIILEIFSQNSFQHSYHLLNTIIGWVDYQVVRSIKDGQS